MTASKKIINLGFALANFGSAMVILAFAEDAVGYTLMTWFLLCTALCIWQGRLWK